MAANLLDGGKRRVTDRLPAYALYTDPPLGRAGMTEAEARRTGRRALEFLGASFLGTSGDEALHCILDAMYAKAPYTILQRAVHIHPTIAEYIPVILGDLVPLESNSDYELGIARSPMPVLPVPK